MNNSLITQEIEKVKEGDEVGIFTRELGRRKVRVTGLERSSPPNKRLTKIEGENGDLIELDGNTWFFYPEGDKLKRYIIRGAKRIVENVA